MSVPMSVPKPSVRDRWRSLSRGKRITAIVVGAVLFILVVGGILGEKKPTATSPLAGVPTTASATSTSATSTSVTPTPPPTVKVTEVIDGRTVLVSTGERIVIAGLAAPGECWQSSSLAFARTALAGKDIVLAGASIRLADGVDFAESALRSGMAKATADAAAVLTSAQASAQSTVLGLWAAPCGGADVMAPAPAPAPAPVTTTPRAIQPAVPAVPKPPAPEPEPEPVAVSYKNCTEVRAAGAAPIHRGEPGYAKHLDRDGDGIGCDT